MVTFKFNFVTIGVKIKYSTKIIFISGVKLKYNTKFSGVICPHYHNNGYTPAQEYGL